jgi:hypothetical protein
MVVPIGEISSSFLLPTIRHMVTVIIDFLPVLPGDDPSVQVKIIDSYRLSLPGCHQTDAIHDLIGQYYRIKNFKREYLAHQSILDRHSCCYFTLKVVQKALEDPVQFGDRFVRDIPLADTWLITSHSWLTEFNKREIHESLSRYFQQFNQYQTATDMAEVLEEVIELD